MDKEDYEEDLLMEELGWCSCGHPAAALSLVRDALRHIKYRVESDDPWPLKKSDELTVFGDTRTAYLVYYLLDEKGYTEQGGGVPGWLGFRYKIVLTAKGEDFLERLEAAESLQEDD